jgi:hypothetical protein
MTHPGVGALTAMSGVLIVGEAERIFGDLFQVVPRFGTWNKNAAPN